MTPWVLVLLGVAGTIATEISVKTRPGTLFSIPLEFTTPKFSSDTPQWVKYEGGAIKGVAGNKYGIFTFKVSENDGSEEVNVQIGIAPREPSPNDCFHQKYFGRMLNLQEKIMFGIPGGHFKDGSRGTVFYYPSSCRDSVNINRTRSGRASGHHEKAAGDEILEMGSGDDLDEDDEEDDYEEEDEVGHLEGPLQPTPTLSYYHPETISSENDEVENLSTPIPTATEFPPHSFHAVSSDLFPQEYGSGDFEIQPTTPIPITPSASPEPDPEIIVYTPTLPPDQPVLLKLIEKFQLPAGKVFKFNVANGYFHSPHQIVYFLQPTEKDSSLPDWVTLENGIFIAWPAVADVSDYTINLVAQDTVTNGVTTNEIYLSVRQRQKSRNYNHEFEIEVLKNISHSPQEQLYTVIEKVQEYAGGKQEGDMVVTKVERSSQAITIRWTNESLIVGKNDTIRRDNETLIVGKNQYKCPQQELEEIYLRLVDASGSSKPNSELIRKLAPTYVPTFVGIHLLPQTICAGANHTAITGIVPAHQARNFPPKIQHALDSLFTTAGELFIYKVPETFCYDPDDGYTPFLNLSLLDRNGVKVDPKNWLQFDENNQEFFGLPPPLSSGKPQIEEYTLKCTDTKGKSDNDALEVEISSGTKTDYSAGFRLHFQSPPFNAPEIRKFIEKLGKAMNESLKDILLISYQNSGEDVQFLWHLRRNPTTEAELTQIRRIMLRDDGSFTPSFKDQFKPEFNLTFGQIIPKGRLLGGNTQTHDVDIGGEDVVTEGPILGEDTKAYLITYIIPAVLIAVMVLFALLIACILSKKRKSLPRSSEEARAFIKKGVPIIFQDELEEDKGARSRSPAILREEHPPLPPEYRRSPIQQYQPPPPMNRMGGSRGGVRPGTHYRKPPPYLPP